MGIAGSLVVIVLTWWVAFFTLLPIGVRSQLESGSIVPGTEPAAPAIHNLRWKVLTALAIALVIWAGLFLAIEYEYLRFEDLISPK